MRTDRTCAWIISLGLASAVGVAAADDAAPATDKPVVPALSDILTSSGITATGYVDATYSYQHIQATEDNYNTFALQQASLTIAFQPTSGFGALVNIVDGENPYDATGLGLSASKTEQQLGYTGSTSFYLMQAYAQYITGPLTIAAGKFGTLAGAETWNPTTNTQVTRSLLFAAEPVTNTGLRLTYAATDKLNVILGVNNGWVFSEEASTGSGKTIEAGLAFTPSKTLSATAQIYYGRSETLFGVTADTGLFDSVVTWTVSDPLSVGASLDYGWVQNTASTPSAKWYGVALYANYALNDQFHVALRPEYLADKDGYLTASGRGVDLKEITATLGYDPVKSVEVRLEARYDAPTDNSSGATSKSAQAWVEAYYKF
jgi:Putative beta-barrel porin-2, OmpL-like. bbp2